MRRTLYLLALAGLVGAASSCGDAVSDPAASSGLPTWRATLDLRIGSIDDPETAFSFVGDLEVDDAGMLYSLHPQEGQVRRWTPDGAPAGTIGRQGEGPGEFVTPSALGFAGDTLWVFDRRRYRVSYFAEDGTYLDAIAPVVDLGTREAALRGEYPPRPESRLADGSLYGRTPAFSSNVVDGTLTEIRHVRMEPDGGVARTLAVTPTGPWDIWGVLRDGGGTFSEQPFSDGTLVAVTERGAALLVLDRRVPSMDAARDAAWTLTRLTLSGDTAYARSFPYAPVEIAPASADSALFSTAGELQEWLGERQGTTVDQWREWLAEGMYRPRYHAPVASLLPGRDGTVWVAEHPPVEEGRRWLVLDESGAPVARVLLPEGLRVLAADRARVWGVETDQLDVEYIVRYALSEGGAAQGT